jgi:hypothetical protein
VFWHKIGTKLKGEKNTFVKDIEGNLLENLISRYGIALDELQDLKYVEREVVLGDKPQGIMMIRIFNPNTAGEKGVTIDGYSSLDRHPELILYEGYYRDVNGEVMDINIEKRGEAIRRLE